MKIEAYFPSPAIFVLKSLFPMHPIVYAPIFVPPNFRSNTLPLCAGIECWDNEKSPNQISICNCVTFRSSVEIIFNPLQWNVHIEALFNRTFDYWICARRGIFKIISKGTVIEHFDKSIRMIRESRNSLLCIDLHSKSNAKEYTIQRSVSIWRLIKCSV